MKISFPLALILALLLCPCTAWALEPGQIALIVNKNEPQGMELAQFYARARGIPEGRIITLDLPATDELPADRYTRDVVQPVRQFLKQNNLEKQVTCLVTFYGVPIHLGPRVNSTQEADELRQTLAELHRVQSVATPVVVDLEKLTSKYDSSFRPASGNTIEQLAHRADFASKSLAIAVQRLNNADQRQAATDAMITAMKRLSAPVPTSAPASAPTTNRATTELATPLTRQDIEGLSDHIDQPESRRNLRDAARQAGPFPYAQMLMVQAAMLNPDHSDASLDNELALLWWNIYPRSGWQANPLSVHGRASGSPQPVVMVARLDGPTPQIVRQMIESSIAIERAGLGGKVVIDSRGMPLREPDGKPSAYGAFDQLLRNLAVMLRSKTKLNVVLDEKPNVLQPGPGAVDQVALYCGWYSLDKYVPGMKFERGAVGWHVASFTMGSLHSPYDGDWARSLLNDGCVATIGAVSEPLLSAFPQPDEFFPLILTGKATLAEAYWLTTPLVSWKLSLIGDPLYTPFKSNPALRVEDLSAQLSQVFSDSGGKR